MGVILPIILAERGLAGSQRSSRLLLAYIQGVKKAMVPLYQKRL